MSFLDILKLLLMTAADVVAEWLPVSSSGHLVVLGHYLGFTDWNSSASVREAFSAAVILGAVLASWALFLPNNGIFAKTQDNRRTVANDRIRFYVAIFLAWIPASVAEIAVGQKIRAFSYKPDSLEPLKLTMVLMLIGGCIAVLAEIRNRRLTVKYEQLEEVPAGLILAFGLIPLFGFLPGTCRFGFMILAAVFFGVSRRTAVTLAVFFNMPAAVVFGVIPLIRCFGSLGGIAVSEILTASVLSFLISFFVLRSVLAVLRKTPQKRFGQYRIVFAVLLYLFSIL